MTVSATNTSSGPFTGNGSTTAFPFTFSAGSTSEVQALVNGAVQGGGYSVALNVDVLGNLTGGGTVTFGTPPINGAVVLLQLNPDFGQNLALLNNGAFLAKSIEGAFDEAARRDIYLKGLFNTLSATVAALSSTVSTVVAAAQAAAQAVINAAVFVVTTVSGSTVSTRSLLAGISFPVNGQPATLTEAGREGRFIFSTANNAANVTADPFQGIYVAPTADTTGASGAWVRDVEGVNYQASWWGITTAVANITTSLLSAVALLPSGASLIFGAGTYTQTTSAILFKSGYRLKGQGLDVTKFVMDAGSGAISNIQFVGSNIDVEGIGFKTNSVHAFSNNGPNLQFGNADGNDTTLYKNWRVKNCRFEASDGIIVTASNNTTTATRPKGVFITECVFATDTQGVSLFGAEDVIVANNRFEMVDSTPNNVSCPIRILGSKNVTCIGNSGAASGEYGFLLSPFARFTGTTTIRLQNENVYLLDNSFTNCDITALLLSECLGELIIRNCTFTGDIAGTGHRYAVQTIGAGTSPTSTFDRIEISNCAFIGYSTGFQDSVQSRHLRFKGCRFIGNSASYLYPPDACGITGGAALLLEVLGCDFIMPTQAGSANFRIEGGSSANTIRVFGCTLPEGVASFVVHDPSAHGNTVETGENHLYRAGTFAAYIA